MDQSNTLAIKGATNFIMGLAGLPIEILSNHKLLLAFQGQFKDLPLQPREIKVILGAP